MSESVPRIVWVVLGLSLAAKMSVVGWASGIELILDEVNYMDFGEHLLAHGTLPSAFRPPVYPGLIALSQLIGGADPAAMRILQALIATAAGLTLYRWLLGHVGHRGALLSCTLWSLYPVFIGFTHLLWTETVFLSMLIFFLATAMPAGALSPKRTAAAGVLYGLTCLTRSVMTPVAWLAPLVVMAAPSRWAWRPRPGRQAFIFAMAWSMTMGPWIGHNLVVEGRPILTETSNGYNLWKGNTPWSHPLATEGPQYPGPILSIPAFPYEGSGPRLTAHCEAQHTDTAPFSRWHLSRCARSMAIDHIVGRPIAFLQRGISKLGHALHPSNLLQRHQLLGIYGESPPSLKAALTWGTTLPYLGLIALFPIALRRAPRSPATAILLSLAAYQAAVIFITFGNTRFRLPILLMGMILAAWIPKRD